MLIKANEENTALPSTIYPPSIGFNADYCDITVRNRDPRDNPNFELEVNGNIINLENNKKAEYTLPAINKEYPAKLRATPNKDNLKVYEKKFNIFKNDARCKDFRYSGDSYYSTDIYKYVGTSPSVLIPEKHNLVNTLSATLTAFPKVTADKITITVPKYMSDFWIKEDRISQFTIKGDLNAKEYQFSDMPILKKVSGNSVDKYSAHMFENCTSLVTVALKDATIAEDRAFSNCTALKYVDNFNTVTSVGEYTFFNCTSLLKPKIENVISVGAYGFYNCKSLTFTPSDTKNITSLGAYSFYNTPMTTVRLSTTSLPVGCFDYSEDAFQKVIFTKASIINGLNKFTLPSGQFTNGMLYDGGKKHQVYCGLVDSAWEDNPATSDKVSIDYYTGLNVGGAHNGNELIKNTLVFKAEDENVMGLSIQIKKVSGAKKKELYWFPEMKGLGSGQVVVTHATKPGDGHKYFYVSGTQLYETLLPETMDRFVIRAIDNKGLMANSYIYLQNGLEVPDYEPTANINRVLYFGTATGNISYKIDDRTWSAYFGAPSYQMYIRGVDENYPYIGFRLVTSSGERLFGKNGEIGQVLDLKDTTLSTETTINGHKMYKFSLSDFYNESSLSGGSSTYIEIYYGGFPDRYWRYNLANKLTGDTTTSTTPSWSYTVYFDAMGGVSTADKMVCYNGESKPLPNCTKSGYTFLGWYTAEGSYKGKGGTSYTPTETETLYAHWEEGEPVYPPEKLPDTVEATIEIQKALCNMNSTSTMVEFTGSGSMMTINSKSLYLVQNQELVVRAELYNADGKFINYYDMTPTGTLDSHNKPNVNGYSIRTFEGVSTSHTLKVYYRDNPSFGEFTITLTNKLRY